MQAVPVDTCFHPIRVPRGDGFLYVPCGFCPACHKSFHSRWRSRLESAINTHAATLFITLTYDNEHLPLCEIDPTTGDVVSVTHTRFKRGLSTSFERVDVTDSFLDIDPTFPYTFNDLNVDDLPHFVLSRHCDDVDFDATPRFAVCLRKDVQDFIKRLRITLSRDTSLIGRDTSFTYFICSEYGPYTFRPHYHGLLFFHDSHTASLCHSRYINECWRKSSLSAAALLPSNVNMSRLASVRHNMRLSMLRAMMFFRLFSVINISSLSTCPRTLSLLVLRLCLCPLYLIRSERLIYYILRQSRIKTPESLLQSAYHIRHHFGHVSSLNSYSAALCLYQQFVSSIPAFLRCLSTPLPLT